MRRLVVVTMPIVALACPASAYAVDFAFQGYADLRIVAPDSQVTWIDGGLGKFRFGGTQPDPDFRFAEAVGQATVSLDDDLRVVTTLRVEPEQRTGIDALDAYLVYTPVSSGEWSWSAKAGAFFAPFSLENTDLGWTSPYTLTPSAIDSWFGDELRTIGSEITVRRQTSLGTIAFTGALFCCDDPAGVLMADRGWSFDDRPTGLFEEPHLPNATLTLLGRTAPDRTEMFSEIDNRVGWYTGARWTIPDAGTLSIYRYDNDTDPTKHNDDYFAWHTRFWNAGWESHVGGFSLLAQALRGETTIDPASPLTTEFQSAYGLVAYDFDDAWRVAGRIETFRTHEANAALSEDGHALTAALSWMPRDWLRVTGEAIALDSKRGEYVLDGLASSQSQVQFQLNTRFFL